MPLNPSAMVRCICPAATKLGARDDAVLPVPLIAHSCSYFKKKKQKKPTPKLPGVSPRWSRTGFALWPWVAHGAPRSRLSPATFAEVSGTRCGRASFSSPARPRPLQGHPAPLLAWSLKGGHGTGLINHSARGGAGLQRALGPCAAVGSSSPEERPSAC